MAKLDAPDSPFTAIVLAKAGMVRNGWGARLTCDLGPPTIFPAVSQGALGVEIRADDAQARALCAAISHWPTQWACAAERACLRVLEGGCSVPVGVSSRLVEDGEGGRKGRLALTGCVTSLEGDRHVEHTVEEDVGSEEDAEAVGRRDCFEPKAIELKANFKGVAVAGIKECPSAEAALGGGRFIDG